jgi:hypothetical protein
MGLVPLVNHEDETRGRKPLAAILQKPLILRQFEVGDDKIKRAFLHGRYGFLHRGHQPEFIKTGEFNDLGEKFPAPIILIHYQDTTPARALFGFHSGISLGEENYRDKFNYNYEFQRLARVDYPEGQREKAKGFKCLSYSPLPTYSWSKELQV